MSGNHQLFIGGYDVESNTATLGYQRPLREVGIRVEGCAEPAELVRDQGPNHWRVLANPASEYERIESTQCGRQHPGVQAHPVGEIFYGKGRTGVGAGLQLAHVIAEARQALQPAIAIEEILNLRGGHA